MAYDRVNQDLSEGINGVRVIKSFGLERACIAAFDAQVITFAEHARAAVAFATTRIPLPQIIVAVSHVWVLGVGAVLVSEGKAQSGRAGRIAAGGHHFGLPHRRHWPGDADFRGRPVLSGAYLGVARQSSR